MILAKQEVLGWGLATTSVSTNKSFFPIFIVFIYYFDVSLFQRVLILFFTFMVSPSSAENYTDHSEGFALAFVVEQPGFDFLIKPDENSDKEIRYKPNLRETVGLAGSAFGLSASYLFQHDQTRSERVNKGDTSYDDIRLSTFFGSRKQWRLAAYYTRYSGFYIENSNYVNSSVGPGDPRVQRPDLKFRNGGLSLLHIVTSREFSVSAVTNFTHQQTSSGGSWLIRADLDHTTFTARSAIVPASVQNDFGPDGSLERGGFNTLSLLGGYGHTFVYNNFFFTPLALFGVGIQNRKYKLNGQEESSIKGSRKFSASVSMGYNGEQFYSGLNLSSNGLQFTTGSLLLETQLNAIRITLGRRF